MSRRWARGSTRAWRRLRARVLLANLADNGGRCQIALPGTWVTADGQIRRCLGRADCVHHTRGRAITGDDPRFLVAACTPCNLKAGDPTKTAQYDPPGRSATRW